MCVVVPGAAGGDEPGLADDSALEPGGLGARRLGGGGGGLAVAAIDGEQERATAITLVADVVQLRPDAVSGRRWFAITGSRLVRPTIAREAREPPPRTHQRHPNGRSRRDCGGPGHRNSKRS